MQFSAIVELIAKLELARVEYLKAKGWTERGSGRWRKEFAWGATSLRPVEADLNDAVLFQARYDGEIEWPASSRAD